jgi:hypothetical protein
MRLDLKSFLASLFMLCLVSGCATPRTEFSTFAQVGGSYAVAVDKLLVTAGTAQVNSTSWSMVAEKEDTGMDKENYRERNKADVDRLQVIERLRRHTRLLGQYFGMLEALATSDAPQRTKGALEGIMKGLQGLNLQLPQNVDALPAMGNIVVDLRIRQALQEELNNRKETIRKELFLQEQLLKNLRKQITFALESQQQKQEYTLVVEPLVNKIKFTNPEKWVATRHKIVYMSTTVEELDQASQTATKLREAFEGLLSGEMTIGRLNALIYDIQALLSIAEAIKS